MGMTPWGKVGNTWKEVTALWGKINGAWQLLEEANNEPYNQALALVGIDKVDSLSVVLTNSSYCTKLAGNAEAYGIMKENYSTEISAENASYKSSGLNLLAFKCKCKTWLYYSGTTCDEITGGWTKVDNVDGGLRPNDWNYCATAQGWNNNAINFSGFSNCHANIYSTGDNCHVLIGTTTSKTHTQDLDQSKYLNCFYRKAQVNGWFSFSLSSSQKNAYIRICLNNSNVSGDIKYKQIYIV